jgi:20S proteasome alpha/beta subunit
MKPKKEPTPSRLPATLADHHGLEARVNKQLDEFREQLSALAKNVARLLETYQGGPVGSAAVVAGGRRGFPKVNAGRAAGRSAAGE